MRKVFMFEGKEFETFKAIAEYRGVKQVVRRDMVRLNITEVEISDTPEVVEVIEVTEAVEVVTEPIVEVKEVEVKLTEMEKMLLNGMRNNEYNDALDGGVYSFTAIDYSGMEAKQARGVISSLVKKGFIVVTPASNSDDNETISLTVEGEELFNTTAGEDCSWGGPKLFELAKPEVSTPEPKEVPEVEVAKTPEVKPETPGYATIEDLAKNLKKMKADEVVNFAKELGLAWNESDHVGINRMRAAMEIRKELFPGEQRPRPKKSGWKNVSYEDMVKLANENNLEARETSDEKINRMWVIKTLKDAGIQPPEEKK